MAACLPPAFASENQFWEWQHADSEEWVVVPGPIVPWQDWRIWTGSWPLPAAGVPTILEVTTGYAEWPVDPEHLSGRMSEAARILDGMRPQLASVEFVFLQWRFNMKPGSGVTAEDVHQEAQNFCSWWTRYWHTLSLYYGWLGRFRYWERRGLV